MGLFLKPLDKSSNYRKRGKSSTTPSPSFGKEGSDLGKGLLSQS
jgi:hypothetical protein